MSAEIWILAEHRDGVFTDAALGLLGEGRRLCRKIAGTRLCALVAGVRPENPGEALGPYGADQVYCFEPEGPDTPSPDFLAALVAGFAAEKNPFLILLAANSAGSDIAPRVAVRLRAPLVTGCVDIKWGTDRRLEFVKPVSDEMLYASVYAEQEGVQIATMEPHLLETEEPDRGRKAEVVLLHPALPGHTEPVRLLARTRGNPETIDLGEAEVVVAGGRGMGDAEAFRLIHDLARLLEGSVGGSRPVVDAGILPFARQIGRTGRNTAPRLLIACGISGASEFTGGMDRSKQVIAINTDRNAPILKMADLGIVADARQVIREVLGLIREEKDREQQASVKIDPAP